jgi:hypothetical protein
MADSTIGLFLYLITLLALIPKKIEKERRTRREEKKVILFQQKVFSCGEVSEKPVLRRLSILESTTAFQCGA